MHGDLIRPDSRLTLDLLETYLSSGEWNAGTLDEYLWQAASTQPDSEALVSYEIETGRRRSVTYSQYADQVERIALGLAQSGVQPGDCVAVMLPNCPEFAIVIFAIFRLGAVYSGIPTAYRGREVSFMLKRTGANTLIVPSVFRNRDYVEFVRDELGELVDVDRVVVVAADDKEVPTGAKWLSWSRLKESGSDSLPEPPDPERLAHVGFTSGTTGEPKGVMNTHQTLDAVATRWIDFMGHGVVDRNTVNLVASPIGHHTGFLWGVLLTAKLAATAVLVDRWDPEASASIIEFEKVSTMFGAPAFLQDLMNLGKPASTWSSMRMVSIPGAPIPRGLVPQARSAMECDVIPAWGMTEYGIGISGAPHLERGRVENTDGVPVPGCDVRIVDSGVAVPPGIEGDLEIRGAGLFIGYLDRPDFTAEVFDGEGWFATGDRAVHDPDGFVSLVGRTKDIVIRGGENIPVVEVETLLYEHPAVRDVAIVGVPDERLGERACAFLVVETGCDVPGVNDIAEYLMEKGVSKHFLPEYVLTVDVLPRTVSGKVKKVALRTQARSEISRRT